MKAKKYTIFIHSIEFSYTNNSLKCMKYHDIHLFLEVISFLVGT